MNTGNEQTAPKNFMISVDGDFSAAELQADLDAWLLDRSQAGSTPPKPDVKQIVKSERISPAENEETIVLLTEYANSVSGFRHFLDLFHDFITDSEEYDISSGLWDFHSFIKTLIRFFLKPGNAQAYAEAGGGTRDLSKYLPDLMELIAEMAQSDHAMAMLEVAHYRKNPQTVTRKHHEQLLRMYGLEPKAILPLPDLGKQAA